MCDTCKEPSALPRMTPALQMAPPIQKELMRPGREKRRERGHNDTFTVVVKSAPLPVNSSRTVVTNMNLNKLQKLLEGSMLQLWGHKK